MLPCTISNFIYNFLGDIGAFDLPFIGDPLLNLVSFINDAIGCH